MRTRLIAIQDVVTEVSPATKWIKDAIETRSDEKLSYIESRLNSALAEANKE